MQPAPLPIIRRMHRLFHRAFHMRDLDRARVDFAPLGNPTEALGLRPLGDGGDR